MRGLLYRTWLRLSSGRERWHDRKFPPHFIFEPIDEQRAVCEWAGVRLTVGTSALPQGGRDSAHLLLSGPSVREIRDPEVLRTRPLMCVNGSPILLGDRHFDHYHVVDRSYPTKHKAEFENHVTRCGYFWIGMEMLQQLMETSDPSFLKRIPFQVYDDYRRPFRTARRKPVEEENEDCVCASELICFSRNLKKGLFHSPTVAYSAIQLLYHLYPGTIYVFGLDLGDTGRFYASDTPQTLERSRQRIFAEMALASAVFRDSGRVLLNCSPISALPITHMERWDPGSALAFQDIERQREANPSAVNSALP